MSLLATIATRQVFAAARPSIVNSSSIYNVANYGTATPSGVEFPKRPVSAYLKFALEMKPQVAKTASILQASKQLGQMWKELPEEKRTVYVEAVRKELETWKVEKAAIETKFADTKQLEDYLAEKKKKKTDRQMRKLSADRRQILNETEKPKRYPQPHSLYIKDKLHGLKDKNPDTPVSDLFGSLIDEWRTLSDDKKAKYVEQSEKLRAQYFDAMAAWNDKIVKSGKAMDLEKAEQKLKAAKTGKAEVTEKAKPSTKTAKSGKAEGSEKAKQSTKTAKVKKNDV